jgi:proton translocating ATP synthase F1 alpha subunit
MDGVIEVVGLKDTAYGELVIINCKHIGFVCNLNKNTVDILILGDDRFILPGHNVIGTLEGLTIPVSKLLLGHVINPLGEIIDGSIKDIDSFYKANVHVKAPGIIFRERVSEPMLTGIKIIDSLIPIGKGQRELIIGDKGTGKTSICFDTILNQRYENDENPLDKVYCIYVAIGQKKSNIKMIYDNLKKFNALNYTVIVSATASDSAALQYLAPYAGCALAEYFMSFANSLIIYDDLSQHAVAYRQMSLLLRRPPGREAYPGDVFYLHSRLLERAVKLHKKYGGGSLTALPIVETLFGDVTAYIPTNVISITDGQIFLDKNLFTEGILPAVNIGLSVSRVGSAAQTLSMKKIAGSLKLELAQYREVKDFVKFGSDLSDETLYLIKRGQLLTEMLKQKRFSPVILEEQILNLYATLNGFLDNIKLNKINIFFNQLNKFFLSSRLFKLHFMSLRNNEYFSLFGTSVLNVGVFYFKNFVFLVK